MRTAHAFLERFDGPDVNGGEHAGDSYDIRVQQEKASAYAQGVAAGEASAKARHMEGEEFLNNAVARLDDAIECLGQRFTEELAGALIAIVQRVFPTLGEKLIAEEFTSRIGREVNLRTDQELVVTAAPQHVEKLKSAVSKMTHKNAITIEADDSLGGLEATARWGCAGIDYDIEEAVRQILDSLEKSLRQNQRDD